MGYDAAGCGATMILKNIRNRITKKSTAHGGDGTRANTYSNMTFK